MENNKWALGVLVIIGLAIVAWVLKELSTSPESPVISTLIFIGVIVYYLFLKSPVKAVLLRQHFEEFINIVLANSDNYILVEKRDRIIFSKKSQPDRQMSICSYYNDNYLVMRVFVYHNNTLLFEESFNKGTDVDLIADSVLPTFHHNAPDGKL